MLAHKTFVGVNFDPTYLIIGTARHRNGTSSLRKQLALRDVSTAFPTKMASEETARKYSIPMTRHYPDDSDWSKRISLAARPIRSTAKISLFLIWVSKDVKLERTTFCLVNIIHKLRYSSILPGNLNFNLFVYFIFFLHNFNKVELLHSEN